MKVRELLNKLSKLDMEAEVVVYLSDALDYCSTIASVDVDDGVVQIVIGDDYGREG